MSTPVAAPKYEADGIVSPRGFLHSLADTKTYTLDGKVAGRLATFRNRETVGGYGVAFQNAVDTNYAIKVESVDGDSAIELFGNGQAHFGANPAVRAAWMAWRPLSPYMVIAAKSGGTTSDAGVVLVANATIDGFETFSCIINAAGNDQGWRFQYNSRPEQGPPNGTHNRPDLFQSWFGYEDDGSWSIVYFKPVTVGAGAYDGLAGKDFRVMPAGSGGAVGEYCQVLQGKVTRGIEIGTNDSGVPNVVNNYQIRIKGGGVANPLYFWVGGARYNLQRDGSGFAKLV